jgi:hypothetical protein
MVSFAGMASYVEEISVTDSIVENYAQEYSDPESASYKETGDLAANTQTSQNCCTAIAVLGALILCVMLPPYFLLIPRNIYK